MKNQFPNSWVLSTIRTNARFVRGVTFSKSLRMNNPAKDSIPIVTTKAAQEKGIDHTKLYFIPQKFVKKHEQILQNDDIIISIANSLELVGRVTPVKPKDIGLTWGAFLGVIRGNSKSVFPHFLYFYLKYIRIKEFFRRNAKTTTNISNISSSTVLSCPIPVPPLAEQKRIVKKIEELFAVIDKNIQKLEHTQQALIQYRHTIIEHYIHGSKRSVSYQKLETCLDYLQPTPYRVHSTDYMERGDIPVLTPGKTFILGYTKEKTGIFTNPLPVIIFDDFTTASKLVGFPFKVKSSAMKILLAKPTVNIRYIFYAMQTLRVQHDTHKRYWISVYSQQKIPVPSLPEQKAIVEKIEKAFACADKAQAAISTALEQAKQLKQSILKRAFEGSLVPQDPNDKPVDLTQLTPKGKTK